MTKADVVRYLVPGSMQPVKEEGRAFAPSNIALCKYWGKRDAELNLPQNSSLSISLGSLGSETKISLFQQDEVWLNGSQLNTETSFFKRLIAFVDLFRPADLFLKITTENNIPTAAGLASSAAGFAALVLALDDLFGWNLTLRDLSILARLGSGSAARSVFSGFVQWHRGERYDGMDSYAESINARWPELRIGILKVTDAAKEVGSTAGMNRTTETSELYNSWPPQAERDLQRIRAAIESKDFTALGEAAECNALAMHATMIAAKPPLLYWQPQTVALFHQLWQLRAEGLPVYFTIDAGPNVKVLFKADTLDDVIENFPSMEIVAPFA